MDFTREPIIETIITPREGFKLVVRNSKGIGQEEYFVEAVEIVSFGQALFFRSLERPKCFMVPVSDYELLEAREARMVLKNVGMDSTIKIAGGREGGRPPRAPAREPVEKVEAEEPAARTAAKTASATEARPEKKRERRRHSRRRRGGRDERLEGGKEGEEYPVGEGEGEGAGERIELPAPRQADEPRERRGDTGTLMSALLPPPTQLISETLERYREDDLFRGVFQTIPKGDEATAEEIQMELTHDVVEEAIVEEEPAPRSTRGRQRTAEVKPEEPGEMAVTYPEDEDLPL